MKVNEYYSTTYNMVRRYGTGESAAEAWEKYQKSPNYAALQWKGNVGLYCTDNLAQASKLYLTFDTSGLAREIREEDATLAQAWLLLYISKVYNYKGLGDSVTLRLYQQYWGTLDVGDWGGGQFPAIRNLPFSEMEETIYDQWISARISTSTINIRGPSQYKVSLIEIEKIPSIIPWPDGNGVAIYITNAKIRCQLLHPLGIPYVPSPKSYTSLKNPHTHAPWDCTEIVWNYFDWCMKYFPFLSSSQIASLPINDIEKIQHFLKQPNIHPCSENSEGWILPQNRVGSLHQDNPKYQAEYFNAYQRHGHTPFEGGEILWNNYQWIKKLNTEMYIWKQTQPLGIKGGFEEQYKFEGYYLNELVDIKAFNRHCHEKFTGGIIAQNEWMELAAERQRIYEFNENTNKEEFNYTLSEPSGLDESILFGESEKSGAPPRGAENLECKSVTEITGTDNPVAFGVEIYNPAIAVPAFGTEVIYNDKQLAIVLNRLIDEKLIRTKEGERFEVPDEPTKAYNVHFHTSPYDGGALRDHEHSNDDCGPIAANDFMKTAIRNKRIEEYNETVPSGEEKPYIDVPYSMEVLAEESQKSGIVPSGKEDLGYKSITEIEDKDDPTGSSIKGIFNPAITAPSFGTEVIFNNRQLAIVLNKLVSEGLIAFPSGIIEEKIIVPEKPSKAYNVHFHTGPYDGGEITLGVGPHAHSGCDVENKPGEHLAYKCFAPFEKKEEPCTWTLYQNAYPE